MRAKLEIIRPVQPVKSPVIQIVPPKIINPNSLKPMIQIIQQPKQEFTKHPKCNITKQALCKYDCNYCYNKSFASSEKVKCWSNKNEKSPREVYKNSNKKYWFICQNCSHETYTTVIRFYKGKGQCQYCNSMKLCDNNKCDACFKRSFASSSKVSSWSIKNDKSPREVFLNSNDKYWFNCDKCYHEFYIMLCDFSSNKGCSYCASQKLCQDENCISCFNKSFASHEKAKCWSERNTKTPREVFGSSDTKYWFKCEKCSHEYDCNLSNIKKGRNCPYCSNKKLCMNENCTSCFEKSFAAHEKVKYWSERNDASPRGIFTNSNFKFWFNCECGHEFETILEHISRGGWCSYCANQKLCANNDCVLCFNKSFASSVKASNWSEKNIKTPRELFKKSQKRYWFKCDEGHEFDKSLIEISIGSWCSYCGHATEKKLLKVLTEKYEVKYQPKYDWCKNDETDRHLPFDFELSDYKIIVELDGRQHFEQVSIWKPPEETLSRDIYKMNKANENGYTVIRIFQEDVLKDKNNWLVKLTEVIKNYENPTRIFISSKDHYENHINGE